MLAGSIEVREGQNLGKLARDFCASHAQLLAATNADAHTGTQFVFSIFIFGAAHAHQLAAIKADVHTGALTALLALRGQTFKY